MTVPEPVYLTLIPTRSFSRRRIGWFPGCSGHDDCRLGTVRVIQEKTKGGTTADQYGVEEDFTEVPPGHRAFVLRNDDGPPDDPERREFYRTVISPQGARCTCTAATTQQAVCKHRDALKKLIEEKLL